MNKFTHKLMSKTYLENQDDLKRLLEQSATSEAIQALQTHDFLVQSDASAIYTGKDTDPKHDDDFGGFACYTASAPYDVSKFDMGCETNMDTNRAELTAAIVGLRRCYQTLKSRGLLSKDMKRTVLWLGDRQNLIDAVANTGSRKADGDLWNTFAYYEQYFKVTAVHVKRDVGGIHAILDRVSSEIRHGMREYAVNANLRLRPNA